MRLDAAAEIRQNQNHLNLTALEVDRSEDAAGAVPRQVQGIELGGSNVTGVQEDVALRGRQDEGKNRCRFRQRRRC